MGAVLAQVFLAQADQPWTLLPGLLLFTYALAVLYPTFGESGRKEKEPQSLSPRWEISLFVIILLTAFFFRIYDINSLPAGMHTDQGLTGLCALRILHEGWRPFGEVFDYQVPELLLFYQLAAWFGLVGSSYFTFHLFFILLSLASFPLVYWAIRQWAGPSTALLSLFILAVMRWNWIATRNGYPSIQVPFYLFGALAFWTYWVQSRKKWALLGSALFVGVGFYTYQAFKIVPLLMAAIAHCDYWGKKKKERSLKPYLLYFGVVLLLIAPLLAVMAQKGVLGHREADLFIGTKMAQEHSLKPLWDVWTGTLLMFNRAGDPNPRHNIPGHRMLDDVTAVFFILGLALAWRRRKEPAGLYPLLGFGGMLLTGLLSTDPAHSNRLVSLTPFVAYFAGSAFKFLWDSSKTAIKKKAVFWVLFILLLEGMTGLNAYAYFVEQANDKECRNAFGPEQSYIGRTIEDMQKSWPGQDCFFIDPSYFKNHTVAFLTYPAKNFCFDFNLWDWSRGVVPKDKTVIFFLEKDKSGTAQFLKTLCPGLDFATYKEGGIPILFIGSAVAHQLPVVKPWNHGLKGEYLESSDWNAKPITIQTDPVLNFTSKFDFPFTQGPPFRIRWTGSLEISKSDDYQFQILTTDNAQLWLDGRSVVLEKNLRLTAGPHRLRLDFEKDSGDSLAVNFIWKEPGSDKWEIVPATAFGKLKP